jgi:hypothetical protein
MPTPDDLVLPNINPRKPGGRRYGPDNPPPGLGRRPGQANRITKSLKTAIVGAAAMHGSDGSGRDGLVGYLLHLAARHPKAFSHLLGKLLPYQLDGTVNSVVAAVRITTVAAGNYLTAEDIAKLQPMTIESEAIDDPIEPEPEVEPIEEPAATVIRATTRR